MSAASPSKCRLAPCALNALTVRIPEACRLTGIGRSKLYELIRAGEIRSIKVGTISRLRAAAAFRGARGTRLTGAARGRGGATLRTSANIAAGRDLLLHDLSKFGGCILGNAMPLT